MRTVGSAVKLADDPDDPNHDWDDDGFTENEGDCNDYNQDPDIIETYYNDIDEIVTTSLILTRIKMV